MRVLLAALMALVMTGCATVGTDVSNEQVRSLEIGETTRAEVIARLGEPNGVMSGNQLGGDAVSGISYTYSKATSRATNFIPFVGLFAGGVDTQTKVLMVWFDKADVVTDYHYQEQNLDSSQSPTPVWGG
ncbi:outer membrane protein assembly factor BamE domain-containing protein [Marinobacter salsuginis]|jgi:outer membrane protein assembly factor BamE (lipoprotein component of BamABCDE complex)|uniref:Outer membrane protein assembly factor BamE domain-containing protein n=1 Tax=Marinobacter salsuginis TaxID=418719 RepID=A0A5M3Q155_9GAMM|nr:outer membrane protein assembly factor BamE [Marinobacter salsuginis]GBO88719.1 hypothetical protein MSSD14B_23870 [Marinobacter salsuginis]